MLNRRSFFSTITGVLCAPLAVCFPAKVIANEVPLSEIIRITSAIDADVDYNIERMAKCPKQPESVDPKLIDDLRAVAKDSSRPTEDRVLALRLLCFIYSRCV